MTFKNSEVIELCELLPVSIERDLRPKLKFVLAIAEIFQRPALHPIVKAAEPPSPDIPK